MNYDRPEFLDLKADKLEAAAGCVDFVEIKHDGRWVWATADGETVTLTSLTGKAQAKRFPARGVVGVFAGEYLHGTTRARTCGSNGAVILFDVVEFDRRDVGGLLLSERRPLLERAAVALGSPFEASDLRPASEAPEMWDRLVMRGGHEGLVFKFDDAFGREWVRLKRTCTIDYVCIGAGAGSVCVGLYEGGELREAGRLFGLTSKTRAEMEANPGAFVGRTLRGTGMELTERGALRHGRFAGWHDKPAEACTLGAARRASSGL